MDAASDASNKSYRNKLVDAYLKRIGSFRKLLTTLLGFTAAFGFFIAWPYLAAVQREGQLNSDITRLDSKLTELEPRFQHYQQPRMAVQQLQRMIEEGPQQLRGYILWVTEGRPFTYPETSPLCRRLMDPSAHSQQPDTSAQVHQAAPLPGQTGPGVPGPDSCAAAEGTQNTTCRIDRFVQFQLCGYEQAFRDRVLPALAALREGNAPLFDQAELEQQFSQVRETLHRHIAANPTFWHTYEDKGEMSVKLQDEVERLWDAVAARMAPVTQDLDRRIRNVRERRTTLKAENTALAKQREELASRLTRIQSPIGNLPIGLTESVLLFPIVLAIGFAMASASLLEQLRLRRALQDAEADATTAGDILSSAQLAQLAPLWIEPASPALQRLARWLLLLVPLLVFIGTVVIILRSDRAAGAGLLQQAAVGSWVYGLLYGVSALTFAVCLWLLRRSMAGLAESG